MPLPLPPHATRSSHGSERLSASSDEEHSQMLHGHVPGAELDRRYIAALENAAYEGMLQRIGEEIRRQWLA